MICFKNRQILAAFECLVETSRRPCLGFVNSFIASMERNADFIDSAFNQFFGKAKIRKQPAVAVKTNFCVTQILGFFYKIDKFRIYGGFRSAEKNTVGLFPPFFEHFKNFLGRRKRKLAFFAVSTEDTVIIAIIFADA